MIAIKRFLVDGKKDCFFSNDLHPVFSFVIENDDNSIKFEQIILEVNNHLINVSELTRYKYEFDDLDYQKQYKATLSIKLENELIEKELTFETPLKEWNSSFISDPLYVFKEKRISPKVMSFKKEFNINKEVSSARAYITAFGVYNFYLNDQKINNEYLLPGFTSYEHQLQYQIFDITKAIKDNNSITVDVAGGWAVGSFVMSRKNRISENKQSLSMKVVLTFVDGSKEEINTDESWLVSTDTPYLFADLYDGEGYDANKVRSSYHPSIIYKTRCRPAILNTYGSPIICKKVLEPSFLYDLDDKHIYDFKQNFAGVVSIKIKKARAGQKIVIKHAEILKANKDLNTSFLRSAKCEIVYICKDGEQTYSPTFTYMGFRYISIEGIAKEDYEVEAFVLSSNNEELASFSCDNALINRLNENIYWSSLSNFMDIPTDCPQRDERMGWTGDIAVFAPTGLYNFDLEAFLTKWLKDLRSEQLRSGGIPNTIPSQGYGFPETMPKMAIDFWGDASILVPYELYKVTGDISILEDNFETMKKYVNASLFWAHLLSIGHHRYIWHTPAIFHFGDWVAPDVAKMSGWQSRSIYTATCSLKNTSSILAEVAKILKKQKEYEKYRCISNKVSKAFNKVLTNGKGIVKKEFQTSYVLPVYFGMFSEENKKNALGRLVDLIKKNNYCIGTGFPGTPYILFALADNGYADIAYQMLLNEKCPSWLYEVKVGGTTIWERWDGLDENGVCPISEDGTGGMISYNHYASGAVGYFLYSRLAGIQNIAPGYRKIRIKPVLCSDIKHVKCSTLTPFGTVKVEYKNEEKFIIEVQVPFRSECELVLPNNEVIILQYGKYRFERKI